MKRSGPTSTLAGKAFCREKYRGPWMKIETRLKKSLENPRHFVVKLPGPMADSSRLEPLHFVVNPLGFWKHVTCCDFAKVFHLYLYNSIFEIQTDPSII